MSDLRIKSLLLHILDDLLDINEFIKDVTKETFISNTMMKKAVCMSLLNIGEMVRNLPAGLFERNPKIPWNSIIGLRNRTAHGYHALDDQVIWEIAKNDMSPLEAVIRREIALLS